MALALSDAQASASLALTQSYKAQVNRDAAKIAALVSLYYRTKVDPASTQSVEDWLALMIPKIIAASDSGAQKAAAFFDAVRKIEAGVNVPFFQANAALGSIDKGVQKSLLVVGPYDWANKMKAIEKLDNISDAQRKALENQAKSDTADKVAAAVVRHAQAGGRQTVYNASQADTVSLGFIRVTRAKPCAFCAMLASRGIQYRTFKEGSFDLSNLRFTGDGDAKVHDECGCSLKGVYSTDDPILKQNQVFADLWSRFGAGGGDAALRFRRGYDHFQETGNYLTFDEANQGLRAA